MTVSKYDGWAAYKITGWAVRTDGARVEVEFPGVEHGFGPAMYDFKYFDKPGLRDGATIDLYPFGGSDEVW